MNRKDQLIMFSLILGVFILGCESRYRNFGNIILANSTRTEIFIKIPRSSDVAWGLRLRVDSPAEGPSEDEKVSIEIINIGSNTVKISSFRSKEQITIDPKDHRTIFNGTIKEIWMLGRTSEEFISVDSTLQQTASLTLVFKPHIPRDMKYKVNVIAFHYAETF